MVRGKAIKFLFFSLLVITFLYGKYLGGFISWFLFYSLLTLFSYIWIISRYSLRSITVTRTFSKPRLTAGDDIKVELVIWNRIEFPHTYIIIKDDQPTKLAAAIIKQKHVVYPWFSPKSIINYTIPKAKRGIHRWQNIELITGDIFGLIQVKKIIPLASEVVIFPKSYQIQKWASRNERNSGLALPQNRISEDAISVIGIREYRQGDRFNKIHWKQSAKVMELMTKEFERFITNDFMFIVNQESKTYLSLTQKDFEIVIELTASLVNYAHEERFPIGIISDGDPRIVTSLSRDQDHYIRIFEILALAEPNTQIPYIDTIKAELSHLSLGTTVVLITPILDENLFNLLGDLAVRKRKIEVFNIHPEFNITDAKVIGYLQEIGVRIHFIPIKKWQEINRAGGVRID